MDFDDGGSGGSTPVQDENENEMGNLEKPSTPGGLIDSVPDGSAGDVEMVSRDEDADGDYVNDGGEVVREEFHEEEEEEEVEREVVEHEVDNDGDDFDADSPAAPMGSPPTPAGSGGGSPPGSPPRSRSPSPAGSVRSRSVSPMGPGPGSPPSAPGSPAGSAGSRSRSNSPQGPGPCSPLGTPGSPAGSHRSGSGSRRGSRSRSGSPASRASRSRSRSGSPARSRSGSGSQRSKSGSQRSRSGSRSRSRSGSRSGSARSRSGSRSGSGSPARSRSGSPTRSRSGSRSRSRSGSRARSRSGSGSRAGSRRSSRSRSRSRSRSPSVAKVRRSSMSGSDKENDDDKVNETDNETPVAKKRKAHIISDDEGSEKGEKADKLIADIFGSDDEDEEFEGFGEADVEGTPKKKKSAVLSDDEGEGASGQVLEVPPAPAVDSDSDEGVVDDRKGEENNFVSDFDRMLERTREEKARQRRKRKDCDLINDNDDLVFDMIKNMKIAAEEDRGLNNKRQAATKKIKILPFILSQLKKSDLHTAFLDAGILSAITEWLAPLPDKSLPHLMIRESLLHILSQFPPSNPESLKSSGIGKAVMYLYKHPKESRKNRELAGKIINEWSRPIFNLTCNFKNLTKEERAQRDYELLPKKQRLSTEGEEVRKDMENAMAGTEGAVRPGDPGFIMRARVPAPSNKDYVNRPHNEMEYVPSKQSKKKVNKYEKHKRAFADRKKHSKAQKAVGISIEGRNMSL